MTVRQIDLASVVFFRTNLVYQKIIIVSGGRLVDPVFSHKKIAEIGNCLIICCDGGARHFQYMGIKPDVIIGDMDSIDPVQLVKYSAQGIKIIDYPANKDFTDTELALDYAMSLKPEEIFIWCALGGRIDHTLANVFLLCKGLEKGIRIYMVDEYGEAFVLDKKTSFINETGKTVSLVALSPEVKGINLTGFLYPMKEGKLIMGESRGVSNIINEARASISVQHGLLLIIRYWQKDIFPEAL
ncbi:MAG: thiamine diphosphokinase [Deltaproteobacteria bacterium]|nr:thiamine diphosphokinase [Deltaproteobacteria bacterium]